jgi:hypothetical protein
MDDIKNSTQSADGEVLFFYIPVLKFIVLTIITSGLYQTYWMYKNWVFIKKRSNLEIVPFWRAVFGIFFVQELFIKIHDEPEANSAAIPVFSARKLATSWILLWMFEIVISISFNYYIVQGVVQYGSLIVSLWLFIPVQRYINMVNDNRACKGRYSAWSTGHTVVLIVGLFIWALVLKGSI